jgi:hypothetical protein
MLHSLGLTMRKSKRTNRSTSEEKTTLRCQRECAPARKGLIQRASVAAGNFFRERIDGTSMPRPKLYVRIDNRPWLMVRRPHDREMTEA